MKPPQRLTSTALVKKEWGSPRTQPWYRNPEHLDIGEVWFSTSDTAPLLVKFLFTRDNLSIQVHPDDEYAREHHNSLGKTEMWHILRAETDARIALGIKEKIGRDDLRAACKSGEIVNLLNWIPVQAGETYFTAAGTIHAIGGGLALCEIQELSDITYRLYDWDRKPPRELHLDHGINVADLMPYHGARKATAISEGRDLLVDCPYFRTERLRVTSSIEIATANQDALIIAIEGEGSIAGQLFAVGEAWKIDGHAGPVEIASRNATLLVTSAVKGHPRE